MCCGQQLHFLACLAHAYHIMGSAQAMKRTCEGTAINYQSHAAAPAYQWASGTRLSAVMDQIQTLAKWSITCQLPCSVLHGRVNQGNQQSKLNLGAKYSHA